MTISMLRLGVIILLIIIPPAIAIYFRLYMGWVVAITAKEWLSLILIHYVPWSLGVFAFFQAWPHMREFIFIPKNQYLQADSASTDFPYEAFNSEDIASHLINLTHPDTPYIKRRGGTEYEQMLTRMLEARHLLIIGRSGMGKTREAVELIKTIEAQRGEGVTVLIPSAGIDIPLRIPSTKLKRNVILFIDDLPSHYSARHSPQNVDDWKSALLSSRERFEQTFKSFTDFYKEKFRVVATAINDPEVIDRLNLNDPFWKNFTIYELPDLYPEGKVNLLDKLESYFKVTVSPEAKAIFAERSDGTFNSLIVPLAIERRNEQITSDIADKYIGTYPIFWEREVYEPKFSTNRYTKNIFAALSILRQANMTPFEFLAVDLAARLCSTELIAWHKWRIKKIIKREVLNPWIRVAEGKLFCQDAYLLGKGSIKDSTPRLLDSIYYLTHKPKYLYPLRASLYELINHFFYEQNPWLALEINQWLLSGNPDNYRAWNRLAQIHLAVGDIESAKQAAREAIRLADRGSAWTTLGLCFEAQKHYEEASKTYIEANTKLFTSSAQASNLIRLGIVLSKLDKVEQSIQVLREAIALDRYNPRSYIALGMTYDKATRYEEAIRAFKKSLSLVQDFTVAWCCLAVSYNKSGRVAEAISACSKATEIEPDNATVWTTLGQIYDRATGHADDAIAAFKKAINLNDQNDAAWLAYGIALDHAGFKKEALHALQKSTELNPSVIKGWKALGRIADDLYLSDIGIGAALKCTELEPEDAENWVNLGVQRSIHKEYTQALEALQKAIDLAPKMYNAWGSIFIVYLRMQAVEQALRAAKMLTELRPDFADAHYHLGISCTQSKLFNEAIAALNRCIEINPQHGDAWKRLSLLYLQLGAREESLTAAKKYAELENENAEAHYILGTCYTSLGDPKAAITEYIKATTLAPNYVDAWRDLGTRSNYIGDFDSAREAAIRLTELDPDEPYHWYGLATSNRKTGNNEQAIHAYYQVVTMRLNKYTIRALEKMCKISENILLTTVGKNQSPYVGQMINAWGRFYSGDFKTAIDVLNDVVKLNPALVGAWYILALSHRALNQDVELRNAAHQVLFLSKNKRESIFQLGWGLKRITQFGQGIRLFDQILEVAGSEQEIAEINNELKNVGLDEMIFQKLNECIKDPSDI
jgi:tetratricopeptide (TPR) repeat protein